MGDLLGNYYYTIYYSLVVIGKILNRIGRRPAFSQIQFSNMIRTASGPLLRLIGFMAKTYKPLQPNAFASAPNASNPVLNARFIAWALNGVPSSVAHCSGH